MLDTPRVTQTEVQLTAVIHLTVPRSEIQKVMGPAIGEVFAAIAAQGIVPAGPWFTYHMRKPSDVFDFEVGVPVATTVVEAGRVKPGRLPTARVARAIYQGPYEGLGAAWAEFETWIAANGYTSSPNPWECYVVGPESSPDPSDWRTELNRQLEGPA